MQNPLIINHDATLYLILPAKAGYNLSVLFSQFIAVIHYLAGPSPLNSNPPCGYSENYSLYGK